MNKVILSGNLGDDPRIGEYDGTPVANFSLATNEFRRDRSGERVTFTEWHDCSLWGRSVEAFMKYVGKGTKLLLEGRLRTKKSEKDGVTHYNTSIVVDRWEIQAGGLRPDAEAGDSGGETADEEAA